MIYNSTTNSSIHINTNLVGGFNPSETYESSGMIIPKKWENKSHVPVTTNQQSL